MTLPQQFEQKMKALLNEQEYQEFANALAGKPFSALHLSPNFSNKEKVISHFAIHRQHPYDKLGYYFDREQKRPGLHPWHEAGAYYIQEPAAMAVIPLAEEIVKDAKIIVDLCAAPGGKTIQAATIAPNALIISCEIDRKRAKILAENIERLGLNNVIVVNCSPDQLVPHLRNNVDLIIADVPCSGEGMFRKDEYAKEDWSENKVASCVYFQQKIIENAAELLKKDGHLIYSTCTYNLEENEQQLEYATNHCHFTAKYFHRFYPHKFDGEGQTTALLQLTKNEQKPVHIALNNTNTPPSAIKYYQEFCQQTKITEFPSNEIIHRGDYLYYLPKNWPSLPNLSVLIPGIRLGIIKKDRFIPDHNLAKFITPSPETNIYNIDGNAPQAYSFIRGETFNISEEATAKNGWILIQLDGLPLGWGKLANGQVKNHYPKGLRKNIPVL